ncbi:MAG: hypothetical protein MJ252_15155 [archaeon]|nr:hypothetical protein [archaeon]
MSEQEEEIIVKVHIEGQVFEINCDTGIQDVAWLAITAASLYGQETFPVSTYLPIIAKNAKGHILHPKSVIMKIKEQIGKDVYVKVRKKFGQIGSELSEKEKEWYENAFMEQRFMMTVEVTLHPMNELRKETEFELAFTYKMNEDLATFLPPQKEEVKYRIKEGKKGEFVSTFKLPMGDLATKRLYFQNKTTGEFDKSTSDFQKNVVSLDITPKILTDKEKEDYLRKKEQKIRDKEMKIQNDIIEAEKAKREEEERFKKLTEEMKVIPFTLEDIYMYVKNELVMDEQLLLEIFALLEKDDFLLFREIFHIFEDYNKLYLSDNMTIDGSAQYNFLVSYFSKRENMSDIIIDFQNEYITRFEKQLEEIDFREFIYILIYLLTCMEKHQNINIIEQIESIRETHKEISAERSYYHLFTNPFTIKDLGEERIGKIQKIFYKLAVKKGKTEFMIMESGSLGKFVETLKNRFGYEFTKMTSNEADLVRKNEYDFIDFLKLILAMAINVEDSEPLEDNEEECKRISECFQRFVENILIAKNEDLLYSKKKH